MMSVDKLPLVLDELGHTPDMIRDTLVKLQIKGQMGQSRHCPIAKYLAYRGFEYPSVSPHGISFLNDDGKVVQVTPEATVIHFIHRFDSGLFPELSYLTAFQRAA